MKVYLYNILYQIYLLPYVKITHSTFLNGDYELIIGWLNFAIVFSMNKN